MGTRWDRASVSSFVLQDCRTDAIDARSKAWETRLYREVVILASKVTSSIQFVQHQLHVKAAQDFYLKRLGQEEVLDDLASYSPAFESETVRNDWQLWE
jgi:hypothetical protein